MPYENEPHHRDVKMAREVDDLCERFEAEWVAGHSPSVEAYLDQAVPDHRDMLLHELLRLDAGLRRDRGDCVVTKIYYERFPGDTEAVASALLPDSTEDPESGRYVLIEEIGRGGMGVVYRATDRQLERRVAVKVLLPEYRNVPEAVGRLEEESRICGGLQHPGVPPVHELGRLSDGRPFLAMKLVEGTTLSEKLAQRPDPRHEMTHWLGVFEQICQAVAYAHAQGVIHRDLKPANVMVGAFGEVQIMDWGLAKRINDKGGRINDEYFPPHASFRSPPSGTKFGDLLGTPGYMSPEQARGDLDAVGYRSDVFALGAILCALLTDKPPFSGADALHRSAAGDLSAALHQLKQCRADDQLVALATDCLAADPLDRPADAAVVAATVKEFLQSVQQRLHRAEVQRAEALVQAQEERKRRRTQFGLAAAVLALLAVAGGAWGWTSQQQIEFERRDNEQQRERVARAAVVNQQVKDGLEQLESLLVKAQAGNYVASDDWGELLQMCTAVQTLLRDRLADSALQESARTLFRTIDQEQRDRRMADRLRTIWSDVMSRKLRRDRTFEEYEQAFVEYGLSPREMTVQQVVDAMSNASPRQMQMLTDGLNRWFLLNQNDNASRDWTFAVLAVLDTDPWRQSIRQAVRDNNLPGVLNEVRKLDEPSTEQQQPLAILLGLSQYVGDWRWESIQMLQHAWRQYPTDYHVNRLLVAGMTGQAEMPWSETARYAMAAVVLKPDAADARGKLAYALYRDKKFDQALQEIHATIEMAPDVAMHHTNQGTILLRMQRPTEAIDAYYRACRCEYVLTDDWRALAQTLLDMGRYGEAVEACQSWLAAFPKPTADEVSIRCRLADALRGAGRLSEAEAEYRRALALAESDHQDASQSLLHRGWALSGLGRDAEALAAWDQCYATIAAPQPIMAKARHFARRGQIDLALREFENACRERPDDCIMALRAAETMREIGQFDASLEFYKRANELDAIRHKGQFRIAFDLYEANEFSNGWRKLESIIAGGKMPDDARRCLWLADCVATRTGHYRIAEQLYLHAIRLEPTLADDTGHQRQLQAIRAANVNDQ